MFVFEDSCALKGQLLIAQGNALGIEGQKLTCAL